MLGQIKTKMKKAHFSLQTLSSVWERQKGQNEG